MKIDVDTKQRLMAAGQMALEFYKVTTGTFLTLFVPQECDGKPCSFSDNMTEGGILRLVALLINAATFLTVIGLYAVEVRREDFCITYLDIDPEKSNTNLDSEIEEYPDIKKNMIEYNKSYLNALKAASAALVFNFGVSSASLIDQGVSSTSIASLASFLLLVGGKMYSAHEVANKSLDEERAFSAYLTIARTYNTIDEDHRRCSPTLYVAEPERDGASHPDAAEGTPLTPPQTTEGYGARA